MRGGHNIRPHSGHFRSGSSPHARGALVDALERRVVAGIIPACAGSTVFSTNFS